MNELKALFRRCPLCAGTQCERLYAQKFTLPEGHPLSAGYDVVACACCGLVYADTAATQADYNLFYEQHSKYDHAATSSGGGAVLRMLVACAQPLK